MALPILQLGSQHELIPQLRTKLVSLGFQLAPTTEPTVFDSAVQAAVVAFQQRSGLEADGIVGPNTWAKLGADPTLPVAVASVGPSWLKLALMLAAAGGLWWWWKKRRAPYGEFSKRISSGGYGDAVDTTLIEEPLLLAERGDCEGAARLLMKRRVFYGRRSSTPKNRDLFAKVAQKVTANCPREVAPLVREAMRTEKREIRLPSVLEDLKQKMLEKQKRVRRVREDTDLTPWYESHPTLRRGVKIAEEFPIWQRPDLPRPVYYPDVRGSRGGKVVYTDNSGRRVTGRTVGKDSRTSETILVEGPDGRRENIRKSQILAFRPAYAPTKPGTEKRKPYVATEAGRLYAQEKRAQATALRLEAKRLENEAARRRAGYRKDAGGGIVTLRRLPSSKED